MWASRPANHQDLFFNLLQIQNFPTCLKSHPEDYGHHVTCQEQLSSLFAVSNSLLRALLRNKPAEKVLSSTEEWNKNKKIIKIRPEETNKNHKQTQYLQSSAVRLPLSYIGLSFNYFLIIIFGVNLFFKEIHTTPF